VAEITRLFFYLRSALRTCSPSGHGRGFEHAHVLQDTEPRHRKPLGKSGERLPVRGKERIADFAASGRRAP